MNLLFEIIDAIAVLGFLIFIILAQRTVPGSWWKVALGSLLVGSIAGLIVGTFIPGTDADLFPIVCTFLTSGCVYIWLRSRR